MFRRIALTVLVAVVAAGLFGGYFFHIGRYAAKERKEAVCKDVRISVLDSLESGIVDKAEILSLVRRSAAGRAVDSVNLYAIEKMLDSKGEIEKSQVYVTPDGTLNVQLTQRRPVVRLENGSHHFYSDLSGYIFPVNHPVKVPVVTGAIPLHADLGYRGYADSASIEWITQVAELAAYIAKDSYWSRQIEQIDVEKNRDIVLYTATGDRKFIFGEPTGKEEKFRKIETFYRDIAPQEGADRYRTVNLKYKNQIICK